MNIQLTQNDIIRELARRDMRYFVKYTHPDYMFSPFNIKIMEALNQFMDDMDAGKRPILIIQAPPQHGKSELASRKFPAFAFGRNPNIRIAGCSYNSDLAVSMNRDIQRIMMNDEYGEVFPRSSLNSKRVSTMDNQPLRNSERFDIVGHRGYYVCAGVGGSLTGKSVDIGIIDDPTKNMQDARSSATKETLLSWYKTVFLTRLSKNSGQLIMATRWAVDDLIGFIIDQNKDNPERVKILKFPAINENGMALFPELHPIEQLLEMKRDMDTASWSALYQQEPIIEGGNLIKSEWFVRYDSEPERFDRMYIVCDTAFTEKKSADNTVFLLCGLVKYKLYILDCYCKKVIFPDMKRDLKAFYQRKQEEYANNFISGIYIENKGSGISLIQELRGEGLPISELYPTVHNPILKKDQVTDKYTRFQEISADLESGYCCIPKYANWLDEFMFECESFDGGTQKAHDDIVDCLIYSLKLRRKTGIEIADNWQDYY